MKDKRNTTNKEGMALLTVLFIVMAITILSLGFLSRSDVELACGKNMILRTQMDYLAESGLEHARGLILNPQDVNSEYWAGDVRQQLVVGSDDYYDVNVVKLGGCNYQISCDAYREKNGEKTGRSGLEAELRFDPCIAYWAGASTAILQRITIDGDVYCNGNVSGNGYVGGDVFASGSISGISIEGKKNEAVAGPPVDWPGLGVGDFSSSYYIGSTTYTAQVVDSNVHPAGNFNPSAGNPAGVRYRSGDVELPGNVNINGMLAVNGNLRITGANNVITAVKNFPALLVSGEVTVEDGGTLEVRGLAQISQRLLISTSGGNVDVDVVGGLFIANGAIEGTISEMVTVDVTAAPAIASIQTWPESGNPARWSPAGGGFFRSIERK
ncbi:MAG: hypothetical protein ACYS0C_04130 [Planctomycetota bacterium]